MSMLSFRRRVDRPTYEAVPGCKSTSNTDNEPRDLLLVTHATCASASSDLLDIPSSLDLQYEQWGSTTISVYVLRSSTSDTGSSSG
jgi:hypothetical protein